MTHARLERSLDDLIKEDTRKPKGGGGRGGGGGGFGSRSGSRGGGGSLEDMCGDAHPARSGPGRGRGSRDAGRADSTDHATLAMRKHRTVATDAATGDVVTTLWETEVVRITQSGDISLNTGGHFTVQTMTCMNEALTRWGFKVTKNSDGTWQVSDGKFRLVRYYDGVVIDRAAVLPAVPDSPRAAPGAVRGGGRGKGAHRYAPY
jgi:hypothetical protein